VWKDFIKEWKGKDRRGMYWNGKEWIGMEWSGKEWL